MIWIDMIWYDDLMIKAKQNINSTPERETHWSWHQKWAPPFFAKGASAYMWCQKPNHNYIHEATSITQSQWASCKTSIQTSNTFKCTAIHCNPLPSIAIHCHPLQSIAIAIQASNSNMPWCLTVSSPKASSCIRKTRPKPTVRLGEKQRRSMGEIRRARSTSSTPSKPHLGA